MFRRVSGHPQGFTWEVGSVRTMNTKISEARYSVGKVPEGAAEQGGFHLPLFQPTPPPLLFHWK